MQELKTLRCFLDGDSLCIVKKEFINLQESEAVFIDNLTAGQIRIIKKLSD